MGQIVSSRVARTACRALAEGGAHCTALGGSCVSSIAIHCPVLRYLPPPCILKYMDTGYRCIADTTVLQYLLKGCIHTCIHGYIGTHATPGP